jgi:hypothetical protein
MVMSEIKVGDTVIVVKCSPCCKSDYANGLVFKVTGFGEAAVCVHCCASYNNDQTVKGSKLGMILASRCKKIPPLNELEDQTEERKVEV